MAVSCHSEPYPATGGLAADGVINQLGRPDMEPLDILIREAVQNCWDARREEQATVSVEIGHHTLTDEAVEWVVRRLLVDPPPELPLRDELRPGLSILYVADFGTTGLGGPTRADTVGAEQHLDFVDFVRNIGQPPDKEFGGGSFGYGKAAFYLASRARTIVIDTLCETPHGPERRLIAAALGGNFVRGGRRYTGRHWWGELVDDVPEPLTGERARDAAAVFGLPDRAGTTGLGTTIAIVAPGVAPGGDERATMPFIAESLAWNFWPKMISTRGGVPKTIDFRLMRNGRRHPITDPRSHPLLREFVEALDHLRTAPDDDDPFIVGREITSTRLNRHLGHLVLRRCRTPPSPVEDLDRPLPQGRRAISAGLHHVALMRTPELVVKYLEGPRPAAGGHGYAGVFRCSHSVDAVFRSAEPPTHDDWIARAVPQAEGRTLVNVALRQIRAVCRETAGLGSVESAPGSISDVPLGEFADGLARLMPGLEGPGARRPAAAGRRTRRRSRRLKSQHNPLDEVPWFEDPPTDADGTGAAPSATTRPRPALRAAGAPRPSIASDGTPVMRYPFELRTRNARVRLLATVQIMTNDGESLESDPPAGWTEPKVYAWIAPNGREHRTPTHVPEVGEGDGAWTVEVPIVEEALVGVDIRAEIVE